MYFCLMKWFVRKKKEEPGPVTASQELFDDSKRILSSFILTIVSAFITIPIFIIVYRYVPNIIVPIGKGLRIDHILTVAVIFTIIRIITYYVRFFLYGTVILLVFVLIIGQIVGGFGFTNIYKKYMDMISYVGSNPIRIPFLGDIKSTIEDSEKIIEAIDYSNPVVRDFAVTASQTYFTDAKYDYKYRNVVKYFSIFRVMSSWKYVSDPKWEDYYAKASESIRLMAGDCDDYSILMAACIKAIGGEVRLVRTPVHIYPEVKVCTYGDFPDIINLIKSRLFYKESLGNRVYYHIDDWNNIWLNFDYNNMYPGGEFTSEKIVGILQL
jgi:hypothetical protein